MKHFWMAGLLVSLFTLGGCRTVKIAGPEPTQLSPKPVLAAATKSLAPKKLSAQELPPVLGGIIQSDSWIIYKDKQQEEFSGHVSYDNEAYVFRAGYALSDRAKGTFLAKEDVFLRQNNPDGSFYQAEAQRAEYNYQTQKGTFYAAAKAPVVLVYREANGPTITATAQKVQFDLNRKIYILQKNVRIERPTDKGQQVLTAQKVTLKQLQQYALLEGNATLTDGERTLQADTIIYDQGNDASYAYGARPLAYAKTQQEQLAVIADKIQSDSSGNRVLLEGTVQGWLVAPQLNQSQTNTHFRK